MVHESIIVRVLVIVVAVLLGIILLRIPAINNIPYERYVNDLEQVKYLEARRK